jgi:hypothetical protein
MGDYRTRGNNLFYPEYFPSNARPISIAARSIRGKPMITLMAMRKQLLLALLATGACYALAVSAIHSKAHAQDATKSCNAECLLKEIDTLDKKVDALERIVDALSTETNKSIKSGQKIILHTDPGLPGGGCLTYVGPSGDLGGFVSWNANCSHGTSWMIK